MASPSPVGQAAGGTSVGAPTHQLQVKAGGGGPRTTTARACIRCRKHKSKCIYSGKADAVDPGPCRRCEDAKTPCVFAAPPALPTVTSLTNGERLSRMEERQLIVERALRSLGVELPVSGHDDLSELPLLAAVAAEQANNRHPVQDMAQLVDSMDRDDVTSTDLLRFGREQRDELRSRHTKRPRRQATPSDVGEPTLAHQQLAFEIFSKRCCVSIPFLEPDDPEHTLEKLRLKSELLIWSIIAVGAREADELSGTHDYARRRAVQLSRLTFGRQPPTLEDFQGFAIVQVWLAPIRPVGHLISLAQELDLHKAPRAVPNDGSDPDPALLERVRAWSFVAITDGLFSVATGKPRQVLPAYATLPEHVVGILMASSRVRDHRLISQLELVNLMCVGPPLDQPESAPSEDFRHLQERNISIDKWGVEWRQWGLSSRHPEGVFSPYASILLQYSFAKLHINFAVLHGIKSAEDVSPDRLIYVHVGVNHAQDLLRVAIEHYQPPIINYTSEYTHVIINFAAVFLLKICRLLPTAFDLSSIFQQISDVTLLLSHICGRFHSESLRVMHQHVDAELRAALAPAVPPLPSFTGPQDNLAVVGNCSGIEGLNLPDGWVDAMLAPTFWSWEANSMVEGLPGSGLHNSLFGEYVVGEGEDF